MSTCIITARFFVPINGSPHGFFGSSRSIRQGGALSPILVIVTEALSRMFSRSMVEGYLFEFLVDLQNVGPLETSHNFADDTFMCDSN
jgi:formate hydrogenlyase subunit 4